MAVLIYFITFSVAPCQELNPVVITTNNVMELTRKMKQQTDS
jgi:hypothetical protein